jgi:hypothetical protein
MDRKIFKAFKSKGLTLSSEASKALSKELSRADNPEGALEDVLVEIKSRIDKKELKSNVIDLDVVISVVAYLSSDEDDLQQESIQLFDAFSSPKILYDDRAKTYRVDPSPAFTLHGSVTSRSLMYRERLLLTQQRLLRSGQFITRSMSGQTQGAIGAKNGEVHELSTIESLLGSEGSKVLFGMLTQVCIYVYI